MNTLKFLAILFGVIFIIFIIYGIYFATLAFMFFAKIIIVGFLVSLLIWFKIKKQ
jgi:hypothetical protein